MNRKPTPKPLPRRLTPALAQLVTETDRNRKHALAATVQAEIDHAHHAKEVAITEFARIAARHDLLLTALIDAGVTTLTLATGDEVTLDDLILDETDDGRLTTAPTGAEREEP